MKKQYLLIIFCLGCSLFIYLSYRSEKILVNQIASSLISTEKFATFRHVVSSYIPLNKQIVFSLPEGLWVFCITLLSKTYFVSLGNRLINLQFVSIVFPLVLETFQWLNFTNGRFDLWDIAFAVFFWILALCWPSTQQPKQHLLRPFTVHSSACILCYLIVYLAHLQE